MNANELADAVSIMLSPQNIHGKTLAEAATMLRQQQTEIDALKLGDIQWKHAFDLAKIEIAELKANVAAKNTSQECVAKTNNLEHKPFAWYSQGTESFFTKKKSAVANAEDALTEDAIPLYSHPHPDNLGFALSIICQQKLEIEKLRKATLTQKSLCKVELTDEDIKQLANEYLFVDEDELALLFVGGSVDFARAILRKAQEK